MRAVPIANNSLKIGHINSPISAGFPSPAQDYTEDEIDLNKILQPHPASTFIMNIKGNSMENANMPDGCRVVVDRSIRPTSGAIVVAVLDGEFTVKRLVKTGRHVVLHPENPYYKPLIVTEEMSLQIWGVVTHVIIEMK